MLLCRLLALINYSVITNDLMNSAYLRRAARALLSEFRGISASSASVIRSVNLLSMAANISLILVMFLVSTNSGIRARISYPVLQNSFLLTVLMYETYDPAVFFASLLGLSGEISHFKKRSS